MSQYAHSQQGACSLRIFSDNILLRSMAIERAGWKLEDIVGECGDSIGIYRENILDLLLEHRMCLRALSKAAHEIADCSEEISHSTQENKPGHIAIITDYGNEQDLESYHPAAMDEIGKLIDQLETEVMSSERDTSGLYNDRPDFPRDYLNIYFVIESSSRMPAIALQVFENTMEELILELKEIPWAMDTDVRIQTITYNVGAQCLDKEPVSVNEYKPHLIEPFGLNNFGEACKKVSSLISLSTFLKNEHWSGFEPIVFYLIRSDPTSDASYGISKLQQNQFYQKFCRKYVCFISDEQDRNMYMNSLGNGITVMSAFSVGEIKRNVRLVELKEEWFDRSPEYFAIRSD
nr:hypothetical protein [uncultured Agathobaculum sp.]